MSSTQITFAGNTYTKQQLEDMTGAELVELHNHACKKTQDRPVSRFAKKSDAVRRTWGVLASARHKEPKPAKKEMLPGDRVKAAEKVYADREKLAKAAEVAVASRKRGTHLKPVGGKLVACREGTKQAALLDCMLSTTGGATMEQLKKATNWAEATVRSAFGWDLKQKGYGVESSFAGDQERFRLVLPINAETGKPYPVPAHTARKGAK